MGSQIQSDLDVKGCRAQLLLNDIPVMTLGPTGTVAQRIAAEQLVVPGRNVLELLVEPGPTPSTARSASRNLEASALGEEPMASAKLVRFKMELEPGAADVEPSIEPPQMLTEARWEWPKQKPLEGEQAVVRFPQSVVTETELGAARGRWRWQDAPMLEPGDELRAEAAQFLEEFDQAFRSGRVDVLWELSRQQNEDVQKCYPGLTEEFLKADLSRVVDYYRRKSAPRDPDKADFCLVAGGRMLHIVDTDWTSSFKLLDPDDGSAVDVPMFLARVDGKLRIVR